MEGEQGRRRKDERDGTMKMLSPSKKGGFFSFFDLERLSHFFPFFPFQKKQTAPEEVLQIKHLRNYLKPR